MSVFNQIKGFLFDVLVFFQRATEPLFARQSWWMAIVLLTVAVRVVLIPLTIKQVRSTRAMQQVQPELKKLQAKHKGDKQKLNEEVMKLYREKGVNPLAGCLPLVLQFPIFIALYRMLVDANLGKNLVGGGLVCLKEAIKAGTCLPKPFLWAPDLAQRASGISTGPGKALGWTLLAVMGATTYISQKQLMAGQQQQNPQMQMMTKFMPAMLVFIGMSLPLGVLVYWVTTNLWTMGQQWVMLRGQAAPEPPAEGKGKRARKR